jgi:tight adherence protein B
LVHSKKKASLPIERKLKELVWKSGKNTEKTDYHIYHFNTGEALWEVFMAILIVLGLTWFFYRSIYALLPMSIIGWRYYCSRNKAKATANRRILRQQFKECILAVSASMQAGYAVENAFLDSLPDMTMLYGQKAMICQEINKIKRGLVLNQTLEELLWDFGKRSGVDEIVEFAEVFSIAKRSGGNLGEVIIQCAGLISHRTESEEEIQTLLTNKRLEQKIMNVMPFGILMYVESGNPAYFADLYHNFSGAAIMTVCLAVYLTAYVLSERILERIGRVT